VEREVGHGCNDSILGWYRAVSVAEEVTFTFGGRGLQVSDFTVPVMRREPHALTLFFQNDETTLSVLEQLPDQIEAGTLAVIPCFPDRVC
jgi:hypothetical protein